MTKIDRTIFPITLPLLLHIRKLGVISACQSSSQDVKATALQSHSFFLVGHKIAATVPSLASLFDAGRKEKDKRVHPDWVDPYFNKFSQNHYLETSTNISLATLLQNHSQLKWSLEKRGFWLGIQTPPSRVESVKVKGRGIWGK